MSSKDVTIYYSTLDSDGMMVGPEPFESDNFDIRCQFQISHKGSSSSNTVYFGLLGLANQSNGVVSNSVLLRVQRGNFAGNVRLFKVRNGGMTTGVSLASGTYNLQYNTKYWIRLVCVSGHFTAYISQTKNWGTPLIDYVWANADYPCPIGFTSPGKGQCGVYARITPLAFTATALDENSTVIPVSALGDFSSFPSSGKVYFAGEYCSYTGKSGTTFGNMNIYAGVTDGVESDIQNMYYDVTSGLYATQIRMTNPGDFAGYAAQWDAGNEINAAWEIASSYDQGGTMISAQFNDSGHANTNYVSGGHPLWHEAATTQLGTIWSAQDNGGGVCYVRPCLNGVVRGQNSTSAVAHTSEKVYLYEEDEIQIFQYEAYDHSEDLATEDLLRMSSWLAGIESEFVTYDTGTVVVSPGASGAWGTPVQLVNNDQANIDIRLTAELASGQSLGVGFRFDGSFAGNGFIASVEFDGTYHYACVYDSNLTLIDKHRFQQLPVGPLEIRVVSCIRVAGDPGTFIAIYLNKMVYTAYVEAYAPPHGLQTAFLVGRGSGIIDVDYVIPEFGDWREAVYLDPNSDAQGALSMIIAERVCKIVSRSGDKLKFSAWDDYGASVVTLTDAVIEDSFSQEDSDVFSYMHVEADNIKEAINPDLMATEGMLIKSFSMPRLIDDQANSAAYRQLRYMEESVQPRSATAVADPRLENEDKIRLGYTAVGSEFTVTEADYVVSDIAFSLGPAVFDMKIGLRKWVNDTIY